MKKSTLIKQVSTIVLCLLFSQIIFGQKSEIEAKVEGLNANLIQGDKLVDYNLINQSKNKIVIIEFWETWCGPCLEAMHHLKNLKDKYPNDLKIICISSDDYSKTVNFIKENPYSFDFVFDGQKKFSAIFPHSGIPHTIVIDKNGKIQVETLPAYLTDNHIHQLIMGESIDVPIKNNFNADNLGKGINKGSLVSFELLNSELGDRGFQQLTEQSVKKRIVTGYSANEFIDTAETIKEFVCANKNILQLYSFAYDHMPESRFLFPENLNYIQSSKPNDLYKLNYSVSSLFGEFNATLIRQLNASLGLASEIIEKDTTVLVLKKVKINGNTIKSANIPKGKTMNTYITLDSCNLNGTQVNLQEIAAFLETESKLPVILGITEDTSYEINIAIKRQTHTIDELLALCEKEGLYLSKEKRGTKYIYIKKAS